MIRHDDVSWDRPVARQVACRVVGRFVVGLCAPLVWLVAACPVDGACSAQSYPAIPGSYQPAHGSPRVFDTQDDLRSMVERINGAGSFSAKMWVKLARQVKADVAGPVDWNATYSGCDIDIYLHAFSFESGGGYAQERRSEGKLNEAMHVEAGMQAPRGAAPVAARLALYAALAGNGAPLPSALRRTGAGCFHVEAYSSRVGHARIPRRA